MFPLIIFFLGLFLLLALSSHPSSYCKVQIPELDCILAIPPVGCWPWVCYLTSLGFNFLICETQIIIVLTSYYCYYYYELTFIEYLLSNRPCSFFWRFFCLTVFIYLKCTIGCVLTYEHIYKTYAIHQKFLSPLKFFCHFAIPLSLYPSPSDHWSVFFIID